MRPALSVLICTKDRYEKIKNAVASILSNTFRDFELLIVDQSIDDKTETVVKDFNDPRMRHIKTDTVGLARARNIAVRESHAEIVVFTDDDCISDPNWLASIMTEYERDPLLMGVYGRVLPYGKGEDGMFCHCTIDSLDRRTVEKPIIPYEVLGHGNNMSFKKDVFRSIGLYIETLGAGTPMRGGEDTEFIYRALRKRMKFVYAPEPVVYHDNWMPREKASDLEQGYILSAVAVFTKYSLTLDMKALSHVCGRGKEIVARIAYHVMHRNRDKGLGTAVKRMKWFFAGFAKGFEYVYTVPPPFYDTKKKLCVIHANCVGSQLEKMLFLSRTFTEEYETRIYTNFTKEEILESDLRDCSLFIYQYLDDKWGDIASERVLSKLGASCRGISIPSPFWRIFWPFNTDYTRDARNVVDDQYPFGKHPYGDSYLLEQMEKNAEKREIIRNYLEADISRMIDIQALYAEEMERERSREQNLDVKIIDYFVDHFRDTQLLSSPNHPTNVLLAQIANQILSLLGFEVLSDEAVGTLKPLGEYHVPIHPSITKYFGLTFVGEKTKYPMNGELRDYLEYLEDYVGVKLWPSPAECCEESFIDAAVSELRANFANDPREEWVEHMIKESEPHRKRYRGIVNLLSEEKGKILDVGFNAVLTSMYSYPERFDIDLANLGPKKLCEGWKIAGKNLPCRYWNIELSDAPYAEGTFDLVLFLEVLEHMSVDPMKPLTEINRISKEGAGLIISTPNIISHRSLDRTVKCLHPFVSGQYLRDGSTDRHNREYTPDEVERLLQCAGYRVDYLAAPYYYSSEEEYSDMKQLLATRGECLQLRGDTIVARSTKVGPVVERYPAFLYF